jgi:DNA/RNA endonuclease YhcR with UshA esterase domain
MGNRLAVMMVATLLFAGCAARGVKIGDLKVDPGRYDDRDVRVTGVVTSSWGVPLVPFQFYSVEDGTGEITVLSRSSSSVPAKGARVQVRGKVGQVASMGGRTLGLHIQEEDRKRGN